MAKLMPFPEVPPGLLKRLEEAFPDRIPRNEVSQYEFGKLAGRQEVIDLLRMNYEKQQECTHVYAKST